MSTSNMFATPTPKTIVLTGGAGFIGHHVVEHLVRKTDWNVVIIDKLSYASSGFSKLAEAGLLTHPRVKILTWDLTYPLSVGMQQEIGEDVSYILHIAAESDVNRSIADPVGVIQNNVMSTVNMLEYARTLPDLTMFYMFSTDETHGVPPEGYAFKETDAYHPRNPYAASKAACEMVCMAYENTYKIPMLMSKMVNCIGQRQHVEKYVPKVIKTVLDGDELIVHADPTATIAGSRYYIHARNAADAALFLLRKGVCGESYNICTEDEIDNLTLAKRIAEIIGKPLRYKLTDFHSERAGHDLVYRLDGTKLRELGWTPKVDFDTSLKTVVEWYLEHPRWLSD